MDFGGPEPYRIYQVAFSLSGSGTPIIGHRYDIIKNVNVVSGPPILNGATFSGLPQDSILRFDGGSMAVDYHGGDGESFSLLGVLRYYLFLPLIIR